MSKFFFNCWDACIFFTCQWLNVGSFICQVSVVILLESYKYTQSPLSWNKLVYTIDNFISIFYLLGMYHSGLRAATNKPVVSIIFRDVMDDCTYYRL
jgi:hypothetical protein